MVVLAICARNPSVVIRSLDVFFAVSPNDRLSKPGELRRHEAHVTHYNNGIMSAMASQTTSLTIVYSHVYPRRWLKKTSKLRVTGLCAGNSPLTGEFPSQKVSNAEMFPFDDVTMTIAINYESSRYFRVSPWFFHFGRQYLMCWCPYGMKMDCWLHSIYFDESHGWPICQNE